MTGKRVGLSLVVMLAVAFGLAAANCGGGSSSKSRPAPRIASVSPAQGTTLGGTTVTIDTTGFSDDFQIDQPSVLFGAAGAGGFQAVDRDSFTVDTPAGAAGTVDVTVNAVNAQTATDTAAFTYVAPPPCSILQVTPNVGDSLGGTPVSIFGTNFEDQDPTLAVTFDGAPASIQSALPSLITVLTPAGPPGGGLVDVVVTSTNTTCTDAGGFEYIVAPSCQINVVNPQNGPLSGGTTVNIGGSGFTGATQVTFGGLAGIITPPVIDTLITVTTPGDPLGQPAGDYDVDVVVITPATSCTLPMGYHYDISTVNCNILGIAPGNGPEGGGVPVVITGGGFSPTGAAAQVLFNGVFATVQSTTDARVDVLTPTGPAGGATVDVEVINTTGGNCISVGGYIYDPAAGPQCSITSITPNLGSAQGGVLVSIVGTQFAASGNGVLFDGNPGNVQTDTATLITVFTPPGSAGAVDVEVVPPGGTPCIDPGGFTYTGCSISDVAPPQGVLAGGNVVQVNGNGFQSDAVVFIDGNVAVIFSPPLPTLTQILVTVPPGAALGSVDVLVDNPTAGTQCTLAGGYTYAGCSIIDVVPNTGDKVGGLNVRINGQNLAAGGGALVRIGLNLATNVDITGQPDFITCDVPPSIIDGPADVEVINNDGTQCILPAGFSYNVGGGANCTISSLTPPNGVLGGGNAVRIDGTGFEPGPPFPGVLFGPNPATVTAVDDPGGLWIDVTAPPGAVAGPVTVSVINASGGTCDSPAPYTYEPPSGCIDFCQNVSMSPTSVPWDTGGLVTISGDCDGLNQIGFCPLDAILEVWQGGTPSGPFSPMSGACDTLQVTIPPSPSGGTGTANLAIDNLNNFCVVFFDYN